MASSMFSFPSLSLIFYLICQHRFALQAYKIPQIQHAHGFCHFQVSSRCRQLRVWPQRVVRKETDWCKNDLLLAASIVPWKAVRIEGQSSCHLGWNGCVATSLMVRRRCTMSLHHSSKPCNTILYVPEMAPLDVCHTSCDFHLWTRYKIFVGWMVVWTLLMQCP